MGRKSAHEILNQLGTKRKTRTRTMSRLNYSGTSCPTDKKHGNLWRGDKYMVCLHQSHYYDGGNYKWEVA